MERLNFQMFAPRDVKVTIRLTNVGAVASFTLASIENVRRKVWGRHTFVAKRR